MGSTNNKASAKKVKDMVNHPEHYTKGGIETIDFIKAKLSGYGYRAYLTGNVIKYMSRAGSKGDKLEDLQKAKWYLDELIKESK